MSVILDGGEAMVKWVESRLPCRVDFNGAKAIGFELNGEVIAGAVFSTLRFNTAGYPHDIEISLAADSPRWATKENIFTILAFPFLQLRCERISAYQPKGNKRARRLVEGVGFKYEGNKRHGQANGKDMVAYGLLRDDFMTSKWCSFG